MLLLLAPAFFSYLMLELLRLYVAPRFVSFLLLPLLVLAAVALVGVGRLIAHAGVLATRGGAGVGLARWWRLVLAVAAIGLLSCRSAGSSRWPVGMPRCPTRTTSRLER